MNDRKRERLSEEKLAVLPAATTADPLLVVYEKLTRALDNAMTAIEVKGIIDRTSALAAFAKIAKNVDMEAKAYRFKQEAIRLLGQRMAQQPKARGGRRYHKSTGSDADPVNRPVSYADLEIGKHLAQAARSASKMSDREFEDRLAAGAKKIWERAETKLPSIKKTQRSATDKNPLRRAARCVANMLAQIAADFGDDMREECLGAVIAFLRGDNPNILAIPEPHATPQRNGKPVEHALN